jgi:hypothetical protein
MVPVLDPGSDPGSDVYLQCGDAFVDAAADQLIGQEAESAFHLVDPRAAGRGEVHVEAALEQQPNGQRR